MTTMHQLRTSWGTKRGIAPYWRRWRRGREAGQACQYHDICVEEAGGKRSLYTTCFHCQDSEGWVHAWFRPRRTFEQAIEDMRKNGDTYLVKSWLAIEKEFTEKMCEGVSL